MKSAFWLGVIIILIAGLAWGVRRYAPGAARGFKSPAMEVLGRTFVDTKTVVVVR